MATPFVPLVPGELVEAVARAVATSAPDSGHGILDALGNALTQSGWLPPDRRTANHQQYARHLLHADPQGRYSILSIVWSPGQMSPVHGHHTWCAVGVMRGEIEETFYNAPVAGAAPVARHTTTRHAGSVSFAAAGAGIHRIANLGSEVAISIHVYGVGADQVTTGINRVYG